MSDTLTQPMETLTDLRTLRAQGVGIVFISHKLREVMEICDRYTVLRDGVMVAEGLVKDTGVSELARHMVGHEVRTDTHSDGNAHGEERLALCDLTQEPFFRHVSLTAHAGEVLGVTGLLGDGRSELFRTVFGAQGEYQGAIRVEGKPVTLHSTGQAVGLGIGYVPRNRKENGIIQDMNILENGSIVMWPRLIRHGLIDSRRQRAMFDAQRQALSIKLEKCNDPISSLSGGNQQKVVLAKWLSADPRVLILDNPTQGVDVGAKSGIYEMIRKLADKAAVIIISSMSRIASSRGGTITSATMPLPSSRILRSGRSRLTRRLPALI